MKKRAGKSIYDKILLGALFMIAAEILEPIPVLGAILKIVGFVL